MHARRPALVIFDCDGVLVDSERLAIPIDVQILGEIGWQITEEEAIERFLGRSGADCNAEIVAHLGHQIPAESSVKLNSLCRAAFERDLQAVDGVLEVVDALQSAAIATCVASSGSHKKMRWTLGLTGLWDHFEGRIFSAEDDGIEHGKPAPDLFLHAATQMGRAASECVVIEDSSFGVQAALAAGMKAFAFAGGLTPRHRLAIEGATLFEHMSDLPKLLGL